MTDPSTVVAELADELGWVVSEDGTWFQFDGDGFSRDLPDMTRDALISREIELRELRAARASRGEK